MSLSDTVPSGGGDGSGTGGVSVSGSGGVASSLGTKAGGFGVFWGVGTLAGSSSVHLEGQKKGSVRWWIGRVEATSSGQTVPCYGYGPVLRLAVTTDKERGVIVPLLRTKTLKGAHRQQQLPESISLPRRDKKARKKRTDISATKSLSKRIRQASIKRWRHSIRH